MQSVKLFFFLQEWVYDHKITGVDELKLSISDEWEKMDQQLIDSAIKQRRKRLAVCVSAGGGHLYRVHSLRQNSKLINS